MGSRFALWVIVYCLATINHATSFKRRGCYDETQLCKTTVLRCSSGFIFIEDAAHYQVPNTVCTNGTCSDKDTCCTASNAVLLGTVTHAELYTLFQSCSGLEECHVFADHVFRLPETTGVEITRITYSCHSTRAFDMCSTGSDIEITEGNALSFNSTTLDGFSANCSCVLTASENSTVTVHANDVRLYNNMSAAASSTELWFGNDSVVCNGNMTNLSCSSFIDDNIWTVSAGGSVTIQLNSLKPNQYPDRVYLYISSGQGKVNCNNVRTDIQTPSSTPPTSTATSSTQHAVTTAAPNIHINTTSTSTPTITTTPSTHNTTTTSTTTTSTTMTSTTMTSTTTSTTMTSTTTTSTTTTSTTTYSTTTGSTITITIISATETTAIIGTTTNTVKTTPSATTLPLTTQGVTSMNHANASNGADENQNLIIPLAVGISVGLLVLAAVLILLLFMYSKKKKAARSPKKDKLACRELGDGSESPFDSSDAQLQSGRRQVKRNSSKRGQVVPKTVTKTNSFTTLPALPLRTKEKNRNIFTASNFAPKQGFTDPFNTANEERSKNSDPQQNVAPKLPLLPPIAAKPKRTVSGNSEKPKKSTPNKKNKVKSVSDKTESSATQMHNNLTEDISDLIGDKDTPAVDVQQGSNTPHQHIGNKTLCTVVSSQDNSNMTTAFLTDALSGIDSRILNDESDDQIEMYDHEAAVIDSVESFNQDTHSPETYVLPQYPHDPQSSDNTQFSPKENSLTMNSIGDQAFSSSQVPFGIEYFTWKESVDDTNWIENGAIAPLNSPNPVNHNKAFVDLFINHCEEKATFAQENYRPFEEERDRLSAHTIIANDVIGDGEKEESEDDMDRFYPRHQPLMNDTVIEDVEDITTAIVNFDTAESELSDVCSISSKVAGMTIRPRKRKRQRKKSRLQDAIDRHKAEAMKKTAEYEIPYDDTLTTSSV